MKAISLVLIVGSVLATTTRGAENSTTSSTYIVDKYDPKRDPADDIKTAVAQAEKSGKRILVQVGGDWCGWCHLMSNYFKENEKVAEALAKNYLIVKVNYSDENPNQAFLKKYPEAKGYPHIYILDSDGKLLHSQPTDALEEGKGYNQEKVLAFLSKWAPKR